MFSCFESIHNRHITIHQNYLNRTTRFIFFEKFHIKYNSFFPIISHNYIIPNIYFQNLLQNIFHYFYIEKYIINYHYAWSSHILLIFLLNFYPIIYSFIYLQNALNFLCFKIYLRFFILSFKLNLVFILIFIF